MHEAQAEQSAAVKRNFGTIDPRNGSRTLLVTPFGYREAGIARSMESGKTNVLRGGIKPWRCIQCPGQPSWRVNGLAHRMNGGNARGGASIESRPRSAMETAVTRGKIYDKRAGWKEVMEAE